MVQSNVIILKKSQLLKYMTSGLELCESDHRNQEFNSHIFIDAPTLRSWKIQWILTICSYSKDSMNTSI